MKSGAAQSPAWLWLLCLGGLLAGGYAFVRMAGEPEAAPPSGEAVPAFDGAAAFADLEAVFALGPRHHGSPGHAACRALIESRLRDAGARVRVEPLTYVGASGREELFANVFGRFGPADGPPLLVGTHYDTQAAAHNDPDPAKRRLPVPAANDGGSGVAVLLEFARRFRARPPPVPVVLAFFDGEDFGGPGELARDYMVGSRHHASRLSPSPADRPAAVVILDMVGERGAEFPRREDFQRQARGLADAIWGTAARVGAANFSDRVAPAITDDHSAFLNLGIPAALVLDYEYGPGNAWWHSTADTPDRCDADALRGAGRVLLEWIYAKGPLSGP